MVDLKIGPCEKSEDQVLGVPIQCRKVGTGSDASLLYTAESCSSSMDLAWALWAQDRLKPWDSLLVKTQSSGRGQFKRQWLSPVGNVYGSLRIPKLGPVWDNLVSLIIAWSMFNLLEKLGLAAAIKWPNDLLVNGRKVGGVLVEERSGSVLIGMGLNLIWSPQSHELRHSQAIPAGSLLEFGVEIPPVKIWIDFVHDLQIRVKRTVARNDPNLFIDNLLSRMAYVGESIYLETHEKSRQPVIFKGLDVNGGIKVLTPAGERLYYSGSICPAA